MSGGPRSRFPRTKSSVSEDRLTIEREKIRHRRPDDMRVHETDHAPEMTDSDSSQYWTDEEHYDEAQSPWSDDNEEWPEREQTYPSEAKEWDEEADDEWVFDDPASDDRHEGRSSEDGGVTWGDNQDIEMGTSDVRYDDEDEISLGPEVELAGRRDVRPRPPKRPRPAQEARRQRPNDNGEPHSQPQTDFEQADDDFALEGPPSPHPARQTTPPQPRGRPARAKATIEIASDSPSSVSRMAPAQRNNRPPSSRRRQSQPATPVPNVKTRSGKRRPWTMLLMLGLVAVGGWIAYQSLGQQDGGSLVDRWGESLGVSGSGRTASDTPFGSSTPTESDLTQPSTAPETTEFLPSATDPSTQADGPPLPKFKPLDDDPGDASSVAGAGAPTSSVQVEELQSNDPPDAPEEAEEGPSVMQKIWGNLISN